MTGAVYALRGRPYYIGLASKVKQINPAAALPTVPPSLSYLRDGVRVSASAGVTWGARNPRSASDASPG